uniref:L-type lectin-domain containing receptor kinase IX.1-like n=1 Tax=Fragaria vesca subsp. vesca TaxID=101020 RepID=UPI0005CB3FED|nr:PREDICTED: L-type lectin-domain containing receptor kinase IX.1-like [Fragaria vesca subsp. vesca]
MGEIMSLSYITDLTNILPEWISVGFSASTSQYGERHKILSWVFDSSLDGVLPPNKKFTEVLRILAGSRLFGTTFKCNKTQRWKYDVFLSFTGETRKGFTHFLYKALQRRGLKVFRDQELGRGTNISSNLLAAIEESRFAIVLSPKYASSTWCLEELTKIMDCMEVKGTTILPIFYKKKPEKEEEAPDSVLAVTGLTATGNLAPIIEEISEGEAAPGRFTCQNIATATNNYSNDNKLGEGASGTVYKGDFTDINITVAVKKISSRSDKGRKEYITEVNLISSLRHPNLVQLKGWCHDEGQTMFLLVYEYMPNGSLDSHLFGTRPPLTWSVRYKICKGLATTLLYLHDAYLHEGWKQCVVHRDIKSSNILLDSSFNAKLGDFGLAWIMYHEQDPKTTQLAGTFGYMDPEYIISGKASRESDVYSFGVVALEIATGKKSVYHMGENSRKGLIQWVWDLYGQGNHFSAVDQRLHWNYDEKQVKCLIFVGLWCAHPDKNQRPSIRQAIEYLNFDAELPRPPMRMPSAVYQVSVPLPSIISGASSSTTNLQVGR